jgi:LemA protein
LTGALKSIFAVAEDYPDLKANENFMELQKELADIENKIAAARRFFNSTTQEYNTYVQIFPNNIVASMFGFKEADMYEVEDAKERENVKVEF